MRIDNQDDHSRGIYAASWILVANPGFYGEKKIEGAGTVLPQLAHFAVWTDNYSSLLRILK